MKPTYRQLLARLNDEPLAMMPAYISRLQSMFAAVDLDEMIADQAATVRANPQASGAVAVIPFIGMSQKREDIWTRYGFGVSTDAFVAKVAQAVNDPGIKAVIFDIDSPGGLVDGTEEAAAAIRSMRGSKPLVAVSNTLMCSAAYWVASAADEVVASPSAMTGSIGVWTMHIDQSGMAEQLGLKVTLISAGKYKVSGNSFEALSEEAQGRIQARVNQRYAAFVGEVAKNRGVTASAVRAGYGEGDALLSADALKAGLIDRVATLGETITRFAGGGKVGGARAELTAEELADVQEGIELEASGETGKTLEEVKADHRGAGQREREKARLALA